MPFKNTDSRYGSIAIFLHWLMAMLIIGMVCIGIYMVQLPLGLQKLKLYGWHKEFGILVLMLTTVRMSWRLMNITPALPKSMPSWQKFAAHTAHYAFYVFMFALPLTGWMFSSASGLPVSFFGLFVLPNFIAPNEQSQILLQEMHKWLAYGLIATFIAHTAAALQHHFIYKDDIMRRILP